MPLYEYKCEGCGDIFEVRQKFAEAPLTIHDKCGGRVERMISAPMLQFKGSGFYVNDYAKGANGGAKPESKSDSSSSESSKSDSSKSDSNKSESGKSESKSENKSKPDSGSKSETKSDSGAAKSESK
jgi:putative FmdB family regulatory protein